MGGVRARRRILGVVVEIVVRVALVVAVVHAFPKVYTNDVSHFWDVWHGLGANNLPYRDFLWEFPPLTVIPVAAAALFSSETAFADFLVLMPFRFNGRSETSRRAPIGTLLANPATKSVADSISIAKARSS